MGDGNYTYSLGCDQTMVMLRNNQITFSNLHFAKSMSITNKAIRTRWMLDEFTLDFVDLLDYYKD